VNKSTGDEAVPWFDWYILVGMGRSSYSWVLSALPGGRYEERSYYDNIANRPDVREFLDHFPWRPEPHAIIIGSRIVIIVGIFMLIFGAVYGSGFKDH